MTIRPALVGDKAADGEKFATQTEKSELTGRFPRGDKSMWTIKIYGYHNAGLFMYDPKHEYRL